MSEEKLEPEETVSEPQQVPPPPKQRKKKEKEYYCKYCGAGPFPNIQLLGVHTKKCPERLKKLEEEKRKGEPPPYKEAEVDSIKILDEILSKHPDITPKIKEEVLDWARLKNGLQPMELQQILQSMRGITSTTASIIASKYSFALMKAQQEGKLLLPPPFMAPTLQQQPQFPFMYPTIPMPQPQQTVTMPQQQIRPPTTQPQQQPYPTWPFQPPTYTQPPYQYPQRQLTPEEIKSIIREEISNFQRTLEQGRERELYVDIEEPVRTPDGKIIIDENNRPVVRRLKVPVSQAHLLMKGPEDTEEKLLKKLELYQKVFGKGELTEDRIREIIRAELSTTKPKPEEELTKEDIMKIAGEAAGKAVKTYIETRQKEEKEEKRHRELLEAIHRAVSSRTTEGYQEDAYRVLGQGLQETASAIRELARDRKPLETVAREIAPILITGQTPKQVETGAAEGLLSKVSPKWITEQ